MSSAFSWPLRTLLAVPGQVRGDGLHDECGSSGGMLANTTTDELCTRMLCCAVVGLVAVAGILFVGGLSTSLGLLQLWAIRQSMAETAADGAAFHCACLSGSGVVNAQQEFWDSNKCQFNGSDTMKGAHFCFASFRRYLRSNRVCSEVFKLTKVVAIPVLPDRPVRPI